MAKVFVDWEEIFVSNDKGSRVVHYYLKDAHGNSDLAVVGREKSLRHMVYTVPMQFLRLADVHGFQPSSSLKWRSKREVVDWLSSLIADYASHQASPAVHLSSDDEDPLEDPLVWKGLSSKKSRFHSKEFTWLGSSWKCRKRRKHYRAFNRNGIKISVHNFVYVMSEEKRRLVAYLEDMYEDSKANKMVVVRWFNNADEVGIVSPPQFSDREIFFSLCLQDVSVECIDGLATILSSQHFEKYLNEAADTRWKPFLCRKQVDGADIKPFDVTQLQGYWNQKILRHLYSSPARSFLKPLSPSYFNRGEKATNTNKSKSKGKDGISLEWRSQAPNLGRKGNGSLTALEIENLGRAAIADRAETGIGNGGSAATRKITCKQKLQQQFFTGCLIEVLSQDSGIRGCWFRALVLKRHGDKVKVQYQDLLDADETGKLEEWVLLSRVATVNDLGIRVCGRTTVRPCPPAKCRLTKGFDVGTVVDARWHDGWWEGIVVFRETEDKVHVYFPGERKIEVFETNSLRHSQEWFSNKWSFLKEKPDVASSVNSKEEGRGRLDKREPSDLHEWGSGEGRPLGAPQQEASAPSDDTKSLKPRVGMPSETETRSSPSSEPPATAEKKREREEAWPVNLEKDNLLAGLKWNPSKKRRRGSLSHKTGTRRHSDGSSSREEDDGDASPGTSFLIPSDMKVDVENCKYGGTTPLVIANMPPLSSLVMSR